MIEELSIRSLGVIDDAVLAFGPGLTVVTGETGAGKTMIVTALGLLRGERADAGTVRHGARAAAAQGVWHVSDPVLIDAVAEVGGEVEDGVLYVGRQVSAEGRGRAQLGGANVPNARLAEIADRLVTIHGQADQQRLRSHTAQRDALDAAGGEALAERLATYQRQRAAWRAADERLATLQSERDARRHEAEALRADLELIERVDPQPGEDDALAAQIRKLEHGEELRATVVEALAALSNDDDAYDAVQLLGIARQRIERGVADDPGLASALDQLVEAEQLAREASSALAGSLQDLGEVVDLDTLQDRRAALGTILRRWATIDEALEVGATGALRLAELDADDDTIAALRAETDALEAAVGEAADALSASRASTATRLADAATAELAGLAMPDARITIAVTPTGQRAEHGADEVEFLLAPHAGAGPRPIAKGASGGELSRVSLALELALQGAADDGALVFDEVDAGVGGAAAIEIGRRLARLARTRQVIVVTHLAQVAAFGDRQLAIEKDSDGQITASSVRIVEGEDRETELARMLGGRADSTSALAHARELLAQSRADD